MSGNETSLYVNYVVVTIATGDDCIAIGSGSSNVNISRIMCGPGHGISIGSLGDGGSLATVEQVHVSNCTFFQALAGLRIKTWQGASGYARDITFEHINMTQVHTPINIDQFYPDPLSGNPLEISDVTFTDIKGTSTREIAINIHCSSGTPCRGLTFNDFDIVRDGGGNISSSCQNAFGTTVGTVIPSIAFLGS